MSDKSNENILQCNDIKKYIESTIISDPFFTQEVNERVKDALGWIQFWFEYVEYASDASSSLYQTELHKCQDVLRYCLYHSITIPVKQKGPKKNQFTDSLFSRYKFFSDLHDAVESVDLGEINCSINDDTKTIKFSATEKAITDTKRRYKKNQKLKDKAKKSSKSIGVDLKNEVRETVYKKIKTLDHPISTLAIIHESSELVKTLKKMITHNEEYFLLGPVLPLEYNIGPFSTESFRTLWRYLQALAMVQTLRLKISIEAGVKLKNEESLLRITKKDLMDFLVMFSSLSYEVVREFIKDMTYDPIKVSWTEPQYQPLVPLSPTDLIIAPLLVLSNNYERNYAVILEKLPWRKEESIRLKAYRESTMIERIVKVARSINIKHFSRLKLKKEKEQVSDIDLVLWRIDNDIILNISLKWHYGPDSVAEVKNHSKRYQENNEQLKRIKDFIRDEPDYILKKCKVENITSDNVVYFFLTVFEEDLPLEQNRIKEFPACTIQRFCDLLVRYKGDLKRLFNKIETEYFSYPSIDLIIKTDTRKLGEYTFLIERAEVIR